MANTMLSSNKKDGSGKSVAKIKKMVRKLRIEDQQFEACLQTHSASKRATDQNVKHGQGIQTAAENGL